MAKVIRREGETLESLYARFKKKVSKEGIIADMKKHREYIKPSEQARVEANEAKRKQAKRKKN